jgi:short-subunit dehydrogenase
MALALITGTSSGIGGGFATRLAQRGYDLIVVARRRERLEKQAVQLKAEFGVKVEVLVADLADEKDLARVEKRLADTAALTLLVNNAAIGGMSDITTMAPEAITQMIAVNVLAVARLARAALPALIANKGAMINVASGSSYASLPGAAVYSATKAFIANFSEGLNAEVGPKGVHVEALIAGLARTELGGAHKLGILDRFPPEMIMEPEDMAEVALVGLELGETICIPSLDDMAAFTEARGVLKQVGDGVCRRDWAPRYRAKARA